MLYYGGLGTSPLRGLLDRGRRPAVLLELLTLHWEGEKKNLK
jgi:hypothetical protein